MRSKPIEKYFDEQIFSTFICVRTHKTNVLVCPYTLKRHYNQLLIKGRKYFIIISLNIFFIPE